MSYILKKDIDFNDTYDVIVIGGGPSGVTASAAAAREGSKTLLIEGTGALGGMGTMGLVPAWCPFSDGEKVIYRSLAQKIFETLRSRMSFIDQNKYDWVAIDAEKLKIVYDEVITEYGVDVLFNTHLSAVDLESDGKIGAVILSNKSGLTAFKAKIYIDCTGDADLAAWSGAKIMDDDNGEYQPATLCFNITNVDEAGHSSYGRIHNDEKGSCIHAIAADEKYPLIRDAHFCHNKIAPRTFGYNVGHLWNVDSTDPFCISKSMIEGRKMAASYLNALKEYCPKAYNDAAITTTAPLLGIRQSRRILGDYVLTIDDYMSRRSFDDEISRNCYFIDIHPSIEDLAKEKNGEVVDENRGIHYGRGESHGIPYRCLTPKGLSNLLIAGRSISCDNTVQGSIRVMPVCLTTGEAAGIAAHIAATENQNVHKVDTNELRKRLKNYGAFIK